MSESVRTHPRKGREGRGVRKGREAGVASSHHVVAYVSATSAATRPVQTPDEMMALRAESIEHLDFDASCQLVDYLEGCLRQADFVVELIETKPSRSGPARNLVCRHCWERVSKRQVETGRIWFRIVEVLR